LLFLTVEERNSERPECTIARTTDEQEKIK
jgi:hypothetical protein